jgi:hypothetical protein
MFSSFRDERKATRRENACEKRGKWVAYIFILLLTLLGILFPRGAGEAAKREAKESLVIGVVLLGSVLVGNELLPRLTRRYEQNRSHSDE